MDDGRIGCIDASGRGAVSMVAMVGKASKARRRLRAALLAAASLTMAPGIAAAASIFASPPP
jgi:hypothetical protein